MDDFIINDKDYWKWQRHNDELLKRGVKAITFEEYLANRIAFAKEETEELDLKMDVVKKLKKRSEFDVFISNELGAFSFLNFIRSLKVDIEEQYLFRFMYLCCNIDYDNMVVFGNLKGSKARIKEKDLREILKLGRSEYFNTKKILLEKELIIITGDGLVKVNPKYCKKGKITSRKQLKESVRMFEEGFKRLYNQVNSTEHKKYSLFIKILPYVNFYHNVLCNNPAEKDIEKIDVVTISELAKILNVNQTRLKNDLLKIIINDELAVGLFIKKDGTHIYVNPSIYYKGNNIDDLKALIDMFKTKKKGCKIK